MKGTVPNPYDAERNRAYARWRLAFVRARISAAAHRDPGPTMLERAWLAIGVGLLLANLITLWSIS